MNTEKETMVDEDGQTYLVPVDRELTLAHRAKGESTEMAERHAAAMRQMKRLAAKPKEKAK